MLFGASSRRGGSARTGCGSCFRSFARLGGAPRGQRYGISSLAEAQAYMAHPVLATRLVECAELVLAVPWRTVHEIFGNPDDLKLHSSMTFFAAAGAS